MTTEGVADLVPEQPARGPADPDGGDPREVTGEHVRRLFATSGFRRLLAVRLGGQLGDGLLQAALASFVLLSPQRQASAWQVAGVLAILLIPYSVLGPFAGAVIDRWPRRQVLLLANVARAAATVALALLIAAGSADVAFAVCALAITSVNRFVLAALPASQPHVVEDEDLVAANAVAPILGSVATVLGGGIGIGLRLLIGAGDPADATVASVTVLAYVGAGLLALRLGRDALGPDAGDATPTVSVLGVARALLAALRHLRRRPRALEALGSVTGMRLALGLWTVTTIVQERSLLHDPDNVDGALGALGLTAALLGVGGVVGALVTPRVVTRIGTGHWVGTLLLSGSLAAAALMPHPSQLTVLLLAALLGFVAQGVKICADTDLQLFVDDAFRGRAFSISDLLSNVCVVVAAVVAAAVLPPEGATPVIVVLTAAAYAVAGGAYLLARRRTASLATAPAAA